MSATRMNTKTIRPVCACNGVTKNEIVRVLKKGARDYNEVKEFTLASAGCGKCKSEVLAVIVSYLEKKNPDLQYNLDFKTFDSP
jgi:bacterioferritin-associated ferredoxin